MPIGRRPRAMMGAGLPATVAMLRLPRPHMPAQKTKQSQ
jgi:hypothetical protein